MLAIDNVIAICFGLISVLLAIISLYVMCKPKAASDLSGLDLELGPRTTSLPPSRAYPNSISSSLPSRAPSTSAYSSLPSRAQISVHNDTYNHLRSIRQAPQRATNQFQNFAIFVPAMTFATAEPSPEPTMELYQVTQSARFISYNRSWG
ncbi:uncharacterized protein EAE98_006484 [Botrytis deweyae]|uniref:Uncharacterized protein n=1 Tax=Botrytis deweyae TaxID=2478750 RepID=A0ABQ7IJH1_9HELO|nr:uncharacterized protein EAE98_006484 [Botrytis deweyae]KAF7926189.1 hypothetical protein EAE98_006484 [Botrytis deweyae]KAF7932375.1 hypothetical protein EAE99_003615 [Botrytis elliptica]